MVALDPLDGPGDGDGDGDPGECWIGAEDCPCTIGGGCDPGLVCEVGVCVPVGESDDGVTGGETGTPDNGIDYVDGDSCSVAGERGRPGLLGLGLLGLLGLGLGLGRRSRRS